MGRLRMGAWGAAWAGVVLVTLGLVLGVTTVHDSAAAATREREHDAAIATSPTSIAVLTGTWEHLAPAPGGGRAMEAEFAMSLSDEEIAVFSIGHDPDSPCAATYNITTGTWNPVLPTFRYSVLSPDEGGACFATRPYFALGQDGLLYAVESDSRSLTIDPSVEPWVVDQSPPFPAFEQWELNIRTGSTIVTGPDGRLYVPVTEGTGGAVSLAILDPIAHEVTSSSPSNFSVPYSAVVTGMAPRVWVYNFPEDGDVVASYDPSTDTWQREDSLPDVYGIDPRGATHGPDGRVYFFAWLDGPHPNPGILAWDPPTQSWLRLQMPADLPDPATNDWSPRMAAGADGRLYVLDLRQPYAFTPGAIISGPEDADGRGGISGPPPSSTPAPTAAPAPSSAPEASGTPSPVTAQATAGASRSVAPGQVAAPDTSASVQAAASPDALRTTGTGESTSGPPLALLGVLLLSSALIVGSGAFAWFRWRRRPST